MLDCDGWGASEGEATGRSINDDWMSTCNSMTLFSLSLPTATARCTNIPKNPSSSCFLRPPDPQTKHTMMQTKFNNP